MDKKKVYQLPAHFYWDHFRRELPAGVVLKETARLVTVELTEDEYDEILSDAEYYADRTTAREMGDPGMASSARATVRRLIADPFNEKQRVRQSYRFTRESEHPPYSFTCHAFDEGHALIQLARECDVLHCSWKLESVKPLQVF